jgi:hypothetical protein
MQRLGFARGEGGANALPTSRTLSGLAEMERRRGRPSRCRSIGTVAARRRAQPPS